MSWLRKPAPESRGVTVYTLAAAEFYAGGDAWEVDDKESLHVLAGDGRQISTHLHGTWVRVEAGSPPEQPLNPKEGA